MIALGANRSISLKGTSQRVDFRIHADFADAARNQLRVLSAKIENQDSVRMNIRHQPIR